MPAFRAQAVRVEHSFGRLRVVVERPKSLDAGEPVPRDRFELSLDGRKLASAVELHAKGERVKSCSLSSKSPDRPFAVARRGSSIHVAVSANAARAAMSALEKPARTVKRPPQTLMKPACVSSKKDFHRDFNGGGHF